MAMTDLEYTKTFTSFSGADIVPVFGGRVIGECQAVTVSVTREKAPIYTMGNPDPRSFSRGKRGIAGSLVFTVFDRDALIGEMSKRTDNIPNKYLTAKANTLGPMGMVSWNDIQSTLMTVDNGRVWSSFRYADQIPPFDITVTFANEQGQTAIMVIRQCEILNQGMGLSIDDITTEQACTFVARALDPLTPGIGSFASW